MTVEARPIGWFRRWLLAERIEQVEGPESKESKERQQPWWKVVCLTGLDYFSTLGYIPGIAALAAGALSPIATVLIVLLTLFAMAPMYRRVAEQSPHGQGSISMLERLLSFWPGKLMVLVLLGFLATDFMITITLSASDAAVHLADNPLMPGGLREHVVLITLLLVGALGAIFLKGFREAINIAVVVVGVYLLLNLVVAGFGLYEALTQPQNLADWQGKLFANYGGNPLIMVGVALLVFPKLALGVSGFETGVSVMPLVRGEGGDDPEHPAGRIRNTRKLLTSAALIMSFYLITTSFVTVVLIPAQEFESGGSANGRALAYLAHEYLGNAFGTIYDLSTITILAFAGASAMAGLLNVVPRYLPRYGMAPEWGRAVRPLVLVYTAIAFAITIIFRADVDAQGGAYATGVLVIMTSAALAVTLSARRRGFRRASIALGLVTLIFFYTLVANIFERPDGIKIASFFIAAIIVISLASRVRRSLELRQERIEIDQAARTFIEEASSRGDDIHIIAHRRRSGNDHPQEYARKLREQREYNHVPEDEPVLFLEVKVEDPSEFKDVLEVRGVRIGDYKVLRAESSVVPNAIAAFLIHLRDSTAKRVHCYFGWTEGNPFVYVIRYILFGEGDTAPVTHEVLREAEPDLRRRPIIHVGGQ
ncbi:MAG TPA: amino acid permease [Rubrobacteraceae bacterium]|nr:amino acid permease [Rubrobacteraceae bacterium]